MSKDAVEKRLSAALARIRGEHPFFGTLALFADYRVDDTVATAATDGRTIRINADFASALGKSEFDGVLLHELLHCALEHVTRRGIRNPLLWNVAADIVVNGMIRASTACGLPTGSVENRALAHLAVEEIYELLLTGRASHAPLGFVDLLDPPVPEGAATSQYAADLAHHWSLARQQAVAVARRHDKGYGRNGLGANRDIDSLLAPRLSWREMLWQFVVSTPTDFAGFDRRFLWQKIYLDAVQGEEVPIRIAIDTSGSIDGELLRRFLSEVQGIVAVYPHLKGELYFADTALYGPHDLQRDVELPSAKGGGGTSFVPFFRAIATEAAVPSPVCVYFTDGYGDFPGKAPELPTIWIVAPGGLESSRFPFGTVARMGIDRSG